MGCPDRQSMPRQLHGNLKPYETICSMKSAMQGVSESALRVHLLTWMKHTVSSARRTEELKTKGRSVRVETKQKSRVCASAVTINPLAVLVCDVAKLKEEVSEWIQTLPFAVVVTDSYGTYVSDNSVAPKKTRSTSST